VRERETRLQVGPKNSRTWALQPHAARSWDSSTCIAMPASPTSTSSSALSASLSLVVLQVVSRLFSFALNQLLLRSTSPHAFGVATIQLDTLIATVLFFVREGLRGAVAVSLSRRPRPFEQLSLTPGSVIARRHGR
jgi:hypothetical protein